MRSIFATLASLTFVAWAPAAHAQLPLNYYKKPNPYSSNQATPYYWGSYPGFYHGNPYAPNYPVYNGVVQPGMVLAAPAPVAGGMYSVNHGGTQFTFWKSPSGYYYPWCRQAYLYPSTTVIYMQEGSNAPALPPLSTMFGDMKKYLSEAKEKGTITEGNYNHLMLRLSDLTKMEQAAREQGAGALNPNDESDIRSKVNDLGLEISRSIKG